MPPRRGTAGGVGLADGRLEAHSGIFRPLIGGRLVDRVIHRFQHLPGRMKEFAVGAGHDRVHRVITPLDLGFIGRGEVGRWVLLNRFQVRMNFWCRVSDGKPHRLVFDKCRNLRDRELGRSCR